MSDLLNKLGSKKSSTEGTGSPDPRQNSGDLSSVGKTTIAESVTSGVVDRGLDLLKNSGSKKSDAGAATSVQASVEDNSTNSASAKVETSADSVKVGDPNSWSIDSAFKEIKKLREENKATRIKYEESVERLKADSESRISARENELQELSRAKQQLDELRAKEEDKERNLAEKLAHRETLIAEQKVRMETIEREYKRLAQDSESRAAKFQAELEAQNQVYKQRLEAELATIPEKFKDHANLIAKGAGDARDAYLAISEAKITGMFEDKKIIVNHSVPRANEGARTTPESLEAASRDQRSKLDSGKKIGMALKEIFKNGQANSAFRTK
jgi:DNA repair exonuclease SbcCD ATPase subunit